jgi:hypothetical protein
VDLRLLTRGNSWRNKRREFWAGFCQPVVVFVSLKHHTPSRQLVGPQRSKLRVSCFRMLCFNSNKSWWSLKSSGKLLWEAEYKAYNPSTPHHSSTLSTILLYHLMFLESFPGPWFQTGRRWVSSTTATHNHYLPQLFTTAIHSCHSQLPFTAAIHSRSLQHLCFFPY